MFSVVRCGCVGGCGGGCVLALSCCCRRRRVVVCSCLFVSEVKFLDLLENELPRKHSPMMFSLIKNEGYGIKDFKAVFSLRLTTNHAVWRMGDQRLDIVRFMVLSALHEKSKFRVLGGVWSQARK